MFSYFTAAASQQPAKLFVPLRRNNYYVNGSETERLAIENTNNVFTTQALDGYGDGYWLATVQDATAQVGRVQTTYRIFQDLSNTGLKVGKTIVVQSLGTGSLIDFGRYIIQAVSYNCAPNVYTDITVYDSVHAKGFSPSLTIQPFAKVAVYFSSDSVSFNTESVTDFVLPTPSGQFKRHFEVYVNDSGQTFTHERGRMSLSSTLVTVNDSNLKASINLNKFDIIAVSPKLRGYQFGTVNKITLNVTSFVSATGIFTGNLASYDGVTFTHLGPTTIGKKGETIRFYDETNTDYIDLIMDPNTTLTDFSNQTIDFQLFPTLQLDVELMLIGTCQVNDATQIVNKIVDKRQFGNISEKDLSTSVFSFMSAPEKYLHSNGIIRGFDIFNLFSGSQGIVNLSGGVILVNGKLIDINNDTVSLPIIKETFNSATYPVNWAVCINDSSEYVTIPLLDFDSVLGSPSTTARTFTAAEFVSGTTYTLPAVLFSDLINKRTDLTVLYVISSVITGTPSSPVITLASKDARKFVYKKDWGERATLCVDSNNGEFRSFEALASWINLNSSYNATFNIKGLFTTFPSSTLSYNVPVKFMGDGTATFTPNTTLSVLNVELNNITLNVQTLDFNGSPMNGCTINLNPTGGGHLVTFNTLITNTTINITGSGGPCNFLANTRLENVTINLNGANESIDFSGTIAKDCTINVNGNSCTLIVDFNATVENCTFNMTGSSTTWSVLGTMINCTVNWGNTTTQSPITVSSTSGNAFNLIGNRFFLNTITNPPTSLLTISDTSNGIVMDNFFYRKANTLTNGYILAPATYTSGLVNISSNFFDNSTNDGSDQNLVKNLPSLKWIYKNNINTPITVNARRITTSGTYTIAVEDNILAVNVTAPLIINLPSIALCPPGRTITIKDANGTCDTNTITIHPFSGSDAIENLYTDYVYNNPYGSITLVAIIDPNGGANGSGLPPKFMWSVV
jgi:hypothetical protein